jgi:hypothetical protein
MGRALTCRFGVELIVRFKDVVRGPPVFGTFFIELFGLVGFSSRSSFMEHFAFPSSHLLTLDANLRLHKLS